MVVQDRLALEIKDLPDEQANLVAAYIEKLKRRNLAKNEKKDLERRRKAMRAIDKLSVKGRRDMDYRAELEEALREKYESIG